MKSSFTVYPEKRMKIIKGHLSPRSQVVCVCVCVRVRVRARARACVLFKEGMCIHCANQKCDRCEGNHLYVRESCTWHCAL